MPPKKAPTSSSAKERIGCWCDGPESRLEIECSKCRAWIHYLCAGITLPELNAAIHEDPGIYLCKRCCDAPNSEQIRLNFKAMYRDCIIHQYDPDVHVLMNLDTPSFLAQNHATLIRDEIQQVREASHELKEVIQQLRPTTTTRPNIPLYSQMAANLINMPSSNAESSGTTRSRPQPLTHQKRPVDPKHTLVVEKVINTHQLRESLSLQIRTCDATLTPLINNAKVTTNGNLLIEAKDDASLDNLSAKLPAILPQLGPESTLRKMQEQATKSAILFNVPTAYSSDTLLQHAQIEFPSATEVVDLKRLNSTAPRRPIKMTLSDAAEFQRVLVYGLKIGWEVLNQ